MSFVIWFAVFVAFAAFTWKAMGGALRGPLQQMSPENARRIRAVITLLDAALMTGVTYYVWTAFIS